jgi:squalene synthase HpnD
MRPTTLEQSYRYCEGVARREAGNFFHAFQVLPRAQRRAMCALYAFLRLTDDLADEPGETAAKRAALAQWRLSLTAALAGEYRHPVFRALHHTVSRFGIPRVYLDEVLDGVESDLEPVRFATFAELYRYCYRVASAVGLACIHIWGFDDDRALLPAEQAGIALQLTNVLRDLPEDLRRGRVYLPADELARFGCDPERLRRGPDDPSFRAMMRFQVERARGYYDAAEGLMPHLSPAGRAVFQVMLRTYRGLLNEIERRDYDVFAGRVRLSAWRKAALVVQALPVRLGWTVSKARPLQRAGFARPHILIVGGGLAGLSAAVALAPRGYRVTILESRNRLGGRASSFTDAATGQLIDACQHVSMGCCTNFAHFCRTVGVDRLLAPQPTLFFMTPDRRVSRFGADPLPAPLHLARAFACAHYLTAAEKARIAYGLLGLRLADPEADPPFLPWLERHGQAPATIDRFWGLVLVSALNETVDRIGLRYARKVFVDGFLRHPRGFEVSVPTVPLARLYGDELTAWLAHHGITLRQNAGVQSIDVTDGRVSGVRLRSGETLTADAYASAVPFDRLLDLLPADVVAHHPTFHHLKRLEPSPITSVHVWFDRPVTELPHVVLIDSVGQWVFNRGEVAPGEHYLQVVVSAARQFRGLGRDEVQRRVIDELRRLFPLAVAAEVKRCRVVTEHAATFSAVPGVDRWRPGPVTPLPNLFLAGDWTDTGWPATMEGAVRSGYRAAEAILRQQGHEVRIVRSDLS